MITMKSPPARTPAKRIITRTESPLTSRKNGSSAHSPSILPQSSARSSYGLSNVRETLLPPLDEERYSETPVAPILIVDDEPYVADLLFHWVNNVWHYPAIIANDGESAIVAMREHHPRMVLLDVHLPDLNGIDVLRAMKSADEFLPIVMVSAEESITTAVEALKAGGYDYLTKPINTDRLQVIIRNALATYSYHEKLRVLQRELNHRYDFSNIISADPRMHDVFKLMRKACDSEINVCILGESGTGKELVARAIHTNGPRCDKLFQVINCAAIPHALLESELFGHEKGSFTGATQRKIGKFEAAQGGTLFLDEIGDMDLMLQSKVLRAIQEHEFERVGGTETIRVDVRIICATNADLQEAIQTKRFREDLYYRIAAFPIMLPPLRERRGDILLLAESFLNRASERQGKRVNTLSRSAMEAMIAYPWPGNIREIESTIERAVILADGDTIHTRDLPLSVRVYSEVPEGEEKPDDMEEFFDPFKNRTVLPLEEVKRIVVHHALSACRGNVSEAAQKLDISRSTMYRFLEIYNIETKNGLALLEDLQKTNAEAVMQAQAA